MEDRIIDHIGMSTDENIKSPHSLSMPISMTSHHTHNSNDSSCSCIDNHHSNFKSSSSCSHTYTSTNNTNTTSHFSISLKSNSPAVVNRRLSITNTSGDIMDNNLQILQLTNSETIDTKDVYVMANEQNNNLNKKTSPHLSVPKWSTDIENEVSADEYDSDAHTITDEDIIIKRVLAKFNQQNQQIIRRKISFVDSFQFFQSNIDQHNHHKNMNSISYRYKNNKNSKLKSKQIKKTKTKSKSKKKKSKSKSKSKKIYSHSREHSESDPIRSNLNNISPRRATIHSHTPPKSLRELSKKPCKHRSSHSHMRTITPFDPITENIFDESDSDYDIRDSNKPTRHKKTLTAIDINININQFQNMNHSPSDSHTMSMNTPEPALPDIIHSNNNNTTTTRNHRKTMSEGPNIMNNISNNNNIRRHASIIPNMENDNVFIDMNIIENDSDNDEPNTPICIKPKLMNSCSSPPMIKTSTSTNNMIEMDTIKQTEWKELEALNEASDEENAVEYMDDDMDDLDFHLKEQETNDNIKVSPSKSKSRHRRLISAPIKLKSEENNRNDLHVYRTWNYFEEMSDSLKSDFNSDISENDSEYNSQCSPQHNDNDMKSNDEIIFGNERVFSTFTKELAITSENPRYLFESLSEICVSLRSKSHSKNNNKIKHQIAFDSPMLRYSEVISFLKLLGFEKSIQLNAYIIYIIDPNIVDSALSSCQQQLIELSKKSTTYEIISNSRLRNGSCNNNNNLVIGAPPILHEKKSDKPVDDMVAVSDLDADRCQLYELIWSATHPNNIDHKAKYVILLCYILITTPIKFIKLLEARFFNDDHGRASRSYSSMSFDSYGSPTNGNNMNVNGGYISANGSPTVGSGLLLDLNSLPSLTTSSITFDYERIQSSYGVQKKVVHMIRLWMQKYWKQDWNNNCKLLNYIDMFVRKANKAYQNDDDFDEFERNKGLELIGTIYKTMQKQKADMRFTQSAISLVSGSDKKVFNLHICRPRSVSSNTEIVNREKDIPIQKRRRSVEKKKQLKHRRKFSLLSAPKLSKRGSYDSTSYNCDMEIPSDLLKISNELICNQLALYLFNKYSLINARECLYQYSPIHKNKENICPNIQIYKDTFNNIVKWVQSTILLQQQVAKRARIIKKWIKITDLLFNIRCFQGFVAVQCALSSQAIYTLKDAWNQNNVLKRKHHTKFKEIKVIMSASHNFENLRRLQREAHAPLIPYFGIFCKDLIYIQEGVSKRNSDGMINWNKLWRISDLIKDHLNYQNTPYKSFQNDINIQNWLTIQLKQYGTLKTEHIDKIAKDVAQKDKNKKIRHKKSFTLMQ